jgi:hypothetical protein
VAKIKKPVKFVVALGLILFLILFAFRKMVKTFGKKKAPLQL